MKSLFSLLAACLFLSLSVHGQTQIGYIDVQKVIFEYKKTRDITDGLEKKLAAHRATVLQERDRIRGMVSAAENTVEEDPIARLTRDKEIRLAQVELEIKEKNVLVQLEQDLVVHMKKVYKEVLREAESIARDRRLQLVLMMNAKTDIEGRSQTEVSSNILVRPILYIDPALDLTAEVIARLNR